MAIHSRRNQTVACAPWQLFREGDLNTRDRKKCKKKRKQIKKRSLLICCVCVSESVILTLWIWMSCCSEMKQEYLKGFTPMKAIEHQKKKKKHLIVNFLLIEVTMKVPPNVKK